MSAHLLLTLAAVTLCAGCDQPARYQAVPATGSPASEERVWIIDTKTGAASLCFESAAKISCLQAGPDFDNKKR